MYPDIQQLKTEPARKDRNLDILAMNCLDSIVKSEVCHPLLEGKYGQVSDHKIVLAELKLPRPKAFTREVHEYLQKIEVGKNKFIERVNEIDWSELDKLGLIRTQWQYTLLTL